jgi:hypothetical protein
MLHDWDLRDPTDAATGFQRVEVVDALSLKRTITSKVFEMPNSGFLLGGIDHSGTRLYLVLDRRIDILSLPDLERLSSIDYQGDVLGNDPDTIAVSPDGSYIAVLERSNAVTVLTANGKVQARLYVRRDAHSTDNTMRFSQDGRWLAASVGETDQRNSIYLWQWSPEDLDNLVCSRFEESFLQTRYRDVVRTTDIQEPCSSR